MVAIEFPFAAELAFRLEEHFCDRPDSRWVLFRKRGAERFLLSGYFSSENDAIEEWNRLAMAFPEMPPPPPCSPVRDQDWKTAYREHFKPWRCRDLLWLPLWLRDGYAVGPEVTVVALDPGMAFGTGDHATTRLCAGRLLDCRDRWKRELEHRSVIDAGCGSGILAISAACMGFAPVRGFDNDPDAVRIARENACINSVGDAIAFQDAGLPDGLEQRSADLILANIQADVLTANAEAFLGSVNKGGVLCLSGILREECAEVEAHFRSAAARMGRPADFDSRAEGDWCDLCVQ